VPTHNQVIGDSTPKAPTKDLTMGNMQNIQPQLKAFVYNEPFLLYECSITVVRQDGLWWLRIFAPVRYGRKEPIAAYVFNFLEILAVSIRSIASLAETMRLNKCKDVGVF